MHMNGIHVCVYGEGIIQYMEFNGLILLLLLLASSFLLFLSSSSSSSSGVEKKLKGITLQVWIPQLAMGNYGKVWYYG